MIDMLVLHDGRQTTHAPVEDVELDGAVTTRATLQLSAVNISG